MKEEISIQAAVACSMGRVRSNNEDNFYFDGIYMSQEEMDEGDFITWEKTASVQLYAVCDGIGGADAGEKASFQTVKELSASKQEYETWTEDSELPDLLGRISAEINREAVQRGKSSGTTIALLFFKDGWVTAANVGDSRIYSFRENGLEQISLDHSKVQRLVSMGILTPEQARTDPDRHVITQFLGMPPALGISPYMVSREEILPGDVYLLCTDGLTDMVEDSRIEVILRENRNPGDAARLLVKTALENGGRDNVTVIVLKAVMEERKTQDTSLGEDGFYGGASAVGEGSDHIRDNRDRDPAADPDMAVQEEEGVSGTAEGYGEGSAHRTAESATRKPGESGEPEQGIQSV